MGPMERRIVYFEDPDDWLDYLLDELKAVLKQFIVFSKHHVDDKELAWEFFELFAKMHFKDQYENVFAVVTTTEDGKRVFTFPLDEEE